MESSFNVVADNLLSGNNVAGVMLDGDGVGPPPIGNTVERNVIGLDAGGSAALPNEYGVVVEDSHRNAITDNVISDNTGHGVLIDSFDLANTDGNWLTGNTISDNGLSGVRIDDADDNSVGMPDRKVNTITGNAQDGVAVDSGQGNAVANNSIYGNDDLGIDLDDDGPTANDGLGDPDTGAERPPEPPDHHRPRRSFPWPCPSSRSWSSNRRSAGRCAAIWRATTGSSSTSTTRAPAVARPRSCSPRNR